MSQKNPQRGPTPSRVEGFAPILALILVIALGVVGYVLIPKPGGIEYIKRQLTWPRPTPTPTPPPGCFYEEVMCVTAPCLPVLRCPEKEKGSVETANWVTYTHPQLGFTFKHPDNIVPIYEKPETVTFVKKQESDFDWNNLSIRIFVAKRTALTPEDAVKDETCIGCTPATTEKVQINNALGLRTIFGFASHDNYYLIDEAGKGPVIRVDLSSFKNSSDYAVFKKVLTTFKFIR